MSKICHCLIRPHAVVHRAWNTSKPRPNGTGLPTWRENAPQQTQTSHQIQAEKGRQVNNKGAYLPTRQIVPRNENRERSAGANKKWNKVWGEKMHSELPAFHVGPAALFWNVLRGPHEILVVFWYIVGFCSAKTQETMDILYSIGKKIFRKLAILRSLTF